MPRDTQILRAATVAAPKDYPIDKNVELILHTVHANFKDNGAGSDWLPCVDLISDSGHTIARCADPNVVVTAGDDAEVTWFPDVKPTPASGPTTTTLAYARAWNDSFAGDAAQSVAAGASVPASFAHTTTTDASIISFSTSVNPNDTASLHALGSYIMFCGTHWDVAGPDLTSLILSVLGAGNAFPHTPIDPGTNPTIGDGIGSATSQDFAVMHKTAGGELENVLLGNQDVAAHLAEQCYFVIIYLATG